MPDFRVVKLDDTKYWHEDIVALAGRIWSVYLVDVSTYVYCCELTPSYCLEFIGSTWERSPEDSSEAEKLWEQINEVDIDSSDVAYVNVGDLSLDDAERMGPDEKEWKEAVEEHDGDQDRAAEALREEYREYMHGNGYVG